MSVFTGKMLKQARQNANMSQEDVAKKLKITDRTLRSIEAGQQSISVDDLLHLTDLYKVDVREFLFESYVNQSEEQILANRYISLLKLYDQLSDRDKEDVIWVIKQRLGGRI